MVSWYKYDFVLGAAVSSRRETLRERNLEVGEKAEFILYDMMGSKLQTIILTDAEELVTIKLNEYASGVYNYQYVRKGYANQAGKIIISK